MGQHILTISTKGQHTKTDPPPETVLGVFVFIDPKLAERICNEINALAELDLDAEVIHADMFFPEAHQWELSHSRKTFWRVIKTIKRHVGGWEQSSLYKILKAMTDEQE